MDARGVSDDTLAVSRGPHPSLVDLVSSGRATSRADLARVLRLSPSTVSLKVAELLDAGVLIETGEGSSKGGRRPRSLEINQKSGYALTADLGAHHLRVARVDLAGKIVDSLSREVNFPPGPAAMLAVLAELFDQLMADGTGPQIAAGVALPGPVDANFGGMDSPSRMPGWHRYNVRGWLAERYQIPVLVENDANAMAMAEYVLRRRTPAVDRPRQTLFVKSGSGIGCGLIVNNQVYRGAGGTAGELAHTRVPLAGDRPCSCGNTGCLETIASGAAIIEHLRTEGVEVNNTLELVQLVQDGDVKTTTRVRLAGRLLGESLAPVVNFLNPDCVVLGGALSQAEQYVAAIRSQLYEGCHPLATRNLVIETSLAGASAGLIGVGRLCLDAVDQTR